MEYHWKLRMKLILRNKILSCIKEVTLFCCNILLTQYHFSRFLGVSSIRLLLL